MSEDNIKAELAAAIDEGGLIELRDTLTELDFSEVEE